MIKAAVLGAILIATAAAAPQTRDVRPGSRPTGVISGTVVSDEPEPKPVRHVRVTCTGSDSSATTITDDGGRFTFPALKAGRYTITGVKDAWITTAYGAKRPTRPGSAIPIAEGQTVAIVLKLLRGSVITGVVMDYNNEPAAYKIVNAMRYVMRDGTRQLSPVASATSDDRGVYRIYGLPPGDYLVGGVRGRESMGSASEIRLLDDRTRTERRVSFTSTYYPGTAIAAQAAFVSVGPGQEREGVDFALQLVPTSRVEGSVTMQDGSPAPAGTRVDLVANVQTAFPGVSLTAMTIGQTNPGGTFSFASVAPGAYTVLARSGSPLTWATTEIGVDGDDLSGLSLGLQPAMTMTGQLTFDATRLKPPADLKSIRLSLQPVDSPTAVGLAPAAGVIDGSGRFEISGILPGRYRVWLVMPGLGRPDGWFLRSITINGQDALDHPMDIRSNDSIRNAVIMLSDRPARLTGTVQNAAGGAPNEFTVVLFPADPSLWRPESPRIFGARPSADGAFAFPGLAPGDYLVAAIDDIEPGEWFDPAVLQRLVPTALKIAIGEGEQRVQDIRLGGGG